MTPSTTYIPLLSSEAGSTLTAAQWMEAGIEHAAYTLEDLLFKPGQAVLAQLDIKHYLGWNKSLTLNGARLKANKEQQVKLKSPYDGSVMHMSSAELMQLLLHLRPDRVLLPKYLVKQCLELELLLAQGIIPFIALDERQHLSTPAGCGFYCTYQEWDQEQPKGIDSLYIVGSIGQSKREKLKIDQLYIETDQPANDALNGLVYAKKETVDLTQSTTQQQFSVIDEECLCPTCSQEFTQAYLHHLFLQTPLLCHRFLIQHNVYQAQKYMLYSR